MIWPKGSNLVKFGQVSSDKIRSKLIKTILVVEDEIITLAKNTLTTGGQVSIMTSDEMSWYSSQQHLG